MKTPTTPHWKRLRQMIRRQAAHRSLMAHQHALLDGVDHAINYMNGYFSATKGHQISDYSAPTMPAAVLHTVWWRAGWRDCKAGKPMNPHAFSRQRNAEIAPFLNLKVAA